MSESIIGAIIGGVVGVAAGFLSTSLPWLMTIPELIRKALGLPGPGSTFSIWPVLIPVLFYATAGFIIGKLIEEEE
jgi:ABC-type microcin C transport system permease subunit YejB